MDVLKANELLEAFSNKDFDLFQELLEKCNDVAVCGQLKDILLLLPSTTLKLFSRCSAEAQQQMENIIKAAIQELIDTGSSAKINADLVNLLANLPLRFLLLSSSAEEDLIHRLINFNKNEELYIALMCRPEKLLLDRLLDKLFEQKYSSLDSYPTKEFIAYAAIQKRQHFISLVSLYKNMNLMEASLRNNLIILKIADELGQTLRVLPDLGSIAHWLKQFNVSASDSTNLQEIHKFFHADFQRLCIIIEFLKQFPDTYRSINIGTLLNTNGVLTLLFENGINASYSESRRLIESIYKWELQMEIKSLRDQEMETLTYYFALATVFEVITANYSQATEQYFASKVQKLNSLLRQMRNIDVVCSLIEDIFQMVFLRWDNIQNSDAIDLIGHQASNRNKSTKSYSGNSSDGDDNVETPSYVGVSNGIPATSAGATLRYGFVCRGSALHCIFSFLKNFVTKKLHSEEYKNTSERIQMRFQRIIEIIGEALWKYAVLEKINDSIERGDGRNVRHDFNLGTEELLQLVQLHVNTLPEKTSSGDESRDRCNYASMTRRKVAKKRRRATVDNVTFHTLGQNDAREPSHSSSIVPKTDPSIDVNSIDVMKRANRRSIIPRMLGSPETLAVMALAINNFNDVKYIIATFNLHNTELDRELSFVENQLQVKQKLSSIYTNYQLEERKNSQHSGEPKATVEHIKNVVAKGFEASKIINVIDNFARTQKIKQSDEEKSLLSKHYSNTQYAHFLHQFKETNLNAVIITDLILNLPFNHETTTNILMVIKRQQQLGQNTSLAELTKLKNTDPNIKLQLPQEIGCTYLLENLCQCLRLLDGGNLRDLLFDNYYSLKPRELALELERERAFCVVLQSKPEELERVASLKAKTKYFHNLQSKNNYYTRFATYVGQLEKLLQLRDNHKEYSTSELLKLDPCDIIGELLFQHNMTPLEIESYVAALNLNLVHVIALNICPEIAGRYCAMSKVAANKMKQQTFYNYISNHNLLLSYLLQAIDRTGNLPLDNKVHSVYLQRLMNLPELEKLAKVYGDNKLLAALHVDSFDIKLLIRVDTNLSKLEILLNRFGNQASLQLQYKQIDDIIRELIEEDGKYIYLAMHIHDITVKAALIKKNFTKIATTRLAKELISSTLQHKDVKTLVPCQLRMQLEDILSDITVYAKVTDVLQFESWPQAYDFSMKTPSTIFEKLLKMQHYKLCYSWCKVVKLAQTATFGQHKHTFFSSILKALHHYSECSSQTTSNNYLLQIMASFPVQDCCNFLQANKDSFRSVELQRYALNYLTENCGQNVVDLKNHKISLVIFEQLNQSEREQAWKLLKYPLLIIEQLIMNAKFEVLAKVLKAVRMNLSSPVDGLSGADVGICEFCFDKRGNFDTQTRSIARNSDPNSTFILLNFNLYQKDHVITNDCIDLLLRIYATKALDYQMSDTSSGISHSSTDLQQSLDSLCGTFQLPKAAPTRDEWVRDEEAAHCMCCRRAVFTMLMRRHHCRRCGRVVCFACSTHRLHIPELYADVDVRICNDCHNFLQAPQQGNSAVQNSVEQEESRNSIGTCEKNSYKWHLSGNITHDKLVREEFCYEHAPSVALCLSILSYHLDQKKCIDLLLYQCRKMEKFIVPNPEVDYELISKMMNCLALAAKVRGGRAEIEAICDHSEIIMSLVQNSCESLIPVGTLKNHNNRKLADSLVQAEKWELALEVHLKYGFPTAGVMAAHGLSCLRAGCYDTGREKLSHCMQKLSHEMANSKICSFILSTTTDFIEASRHQSLDFTVEPYDIPCIKRPNRGPVLLKEILQIIESTAFTKLQPETLRRASIIRNSNTSLSSLLSRRKENPYPVIPMHEPALNILRTLANLKRISKGFYDEVNEESNDNQCSEKRLPRQSRVFDEAMHYVLMYGSHSDIIQFLMRQQELSAALKYWVIQNLHADFLTFNIFLVSLRCGEVPTLIEQMRSLDAQLFVWRDALKQVCRYLESRNLLNSLYQLQLLLKDPIRASMTCVKFYSMGCENFQELHMQAQHLNNAHKHLLSELELSQWDNISMEKNSRGKDLLKVRRSSSASVASALGAASFQMQMDARMLNSHINTILKQLDVAKFLAYCEREHGPGENNMLITEKILKQIRFDSGKSTLPTLFDSVSHKIQICILILLSGKNIEEGFGLAYRIIHDYKIPPMKVFGATAKYLARNQRLNEVEKLINCCNGTNKRDIDEIISIAIHCAAESHKLEVKTALDNLAKKISSVELLISIHIFLGQLKSAYLLANKYERLGDIRKILRQAEMHNQIHIKKLCEKKLSMG